MQSQRGLIEQALKTLLSPPLPRSVVEALTNLFDSRTLSGPLIDDLSDYLWEHHLEELIVQSHDELRCALSRFGGKDQ